MKVVINGTPKDFTAPLNLYDILEQEDMIEMMIAVARNNVVVPRDQWSDTPMEDGDSLEILGPMQGG
ncbi:MAG: sulfur carrier protein ThiS [Alphaproteobacteria bacterium]|nr:sulfur carrier protein ThiS [Alphaproteobacteria bacterium]MCD8520338.1 sulfur carrier protein ThiS [Alphaproteobacteria bacterium]MCD8571711.1 sulfur carrier protein ThiS [Alphaproteobacteria bacterium]